MASHGEEALKKRAQKSYRSIPREAIVFDKRADSGLIGKGSYGAVFRGALSDGSVVAVKQMYKRDTFEHEVNVLCQLDHDNIVRYRGHCASVAQDEFLLITELLEHGNLRGYLKKNKETPLPDATIILVAKQLASALEHLHNFEIPILHRDVKSPNILIVQSKDQQLEKVKLADVGTACTPQIADTLQPMVGTLPWTPPELLSEREKSYSPKADVYSYGVVIWELLTREKPFAGILWHHIADDVGAGRCQLSPPDSGAPYLQRLYLCCTRYDPSLRPAFSKVSSELQKLQQHPTATDDIFVVPAETNPLERKLATLKANPTIIDELRKFSAPMHAAASAILQRIVQLYFEDQNRERTFSRTMPTNPNPDESISAVPTTTATVSAVSSTAAAVSAVSGTAAAAAQLSDVGPPVAI